MRQAEFRDGATDKLISIFREVLLHPGDMFKTCLTCIFFTEETEMCRKFEGERPPARVIAYGCKSYTHDDEIPF